MVDDRGVGEVVELYLVHKSDGDILCESKDGIEIVWFCRNGESIHPVIDKWNRDSYNTEKWKEIWQWTVIALM